jgi:hypothetical protein
VRRADQGECSARLEIRDLTCQIRCGGLSVIFIILGAIVLLILAIGIVWIGQ